MGFVYQQQLNHRQRTLVTAECVLLHGLLSNLSDLQLQARLRWEHVRVLLLEKRRHNVGRKVAVLLKELNDQRAALVQRPFVGGRVGGAAGLLPLSTRLSSALLQRGYFCQRFKARHVARQHVGAKIRRNGGGPSSTGRGVVRRVLCRLIHAVFTVRVRLGCVSAFAVLPVLVRSAVSAFSQPVKRRIFGEFRKPLLKIHLRQNSVESTKTSCQPCSQGLPSSRPLGTWKRGWHHVRPPNPDERNSKKDSM